MANSDHTTLLLNTYTKLKDVARLDSFIKRESLRTSAEGEKDELPFDLDTAFIPFLHSVGCAIGISDPVFMKKLGLEPWAFGQHVKYPYEPREIEKRIKEGDEEAALIRKVGTAWLMELYSGTYRSWDDISFLRKHWKGPIVLKGVLSPEVRLYIDLYGVFG